jgi:hypothetical protein
MFVGVVGKESNPSGKDVNVGEIQDFLKRMFVGVVGKESNPSGKSES